MCLRQQMCFLLSGLCCPGLTTVEECVEDTCLVHVQFGIFRQIIIGAQFPVQFGHAGCSYCYTHVISGSSDKLLVIVEPVKLSITFSVTLSMLIDGGTNNVLPHDMSF